MQTLYSLLVIVIAAVLLQLQEQQRFVVDVPLVTVDVAVTMDGKPITSLSEKDFKLFEDGLPQTIRSFEAASIPYYVLGVSQCGGLNDVKFQQMFIQFVQGIQSHSRLALAEFTPQPKVLHDWNALSGGQVNIPLRKPGCVPAPDFFEGLEWILSRARTVSGSKAVVWFNPDSSAILKLNQVRNPYTFIDMPKVVDAKDDPDFQRALRLVSESRLAFHFITKTRDVSPLVREMARTPSGFQFDTDLMDHNERQQIARLKQLADMSGGKLIIGTDPKDMRPVVDQLNREIGTFYTLSYVPVERTNKTRPRRIEVRVSDSRLRVLQSQSEYVLPR